MINKKIEQLVYPKDYSYADLIKGIDLNKNVYRINILAPSGTWIYVNNDVTPIVLDKDAFDWNVENFGQIEHLQFILNFNTYIWNNNIKQWIENSNGKSLKDIFLELFNSSIDDFDYEEAEKALWASSMMILLKEQDNNLFENYIDELKYYLPVTYDIVNGDSSETNDDYLTWAYKYYDLLNKITEIGITPEDNGIILTIFYLEDKE